LSYLTKVEAQVLTLIRRAIWAEGVLLDESCAVTFPAIRREFHAHFLSSLKLPLLDVSDQSRYVLRFVELQEDLLRRTELRAHPSRSAPARGAIE
jgi:hypothetical protein